MRAVPQTPPGGAARPASPPGPGAPTRADPPPSHAELSQKLIAVSFARVLAVALALTALFVVSQLSPPADRADIGTWQYVVVGVTLAVSIGYGVLLARDLAILPLAYVQIVADTMLAGTIVSMTGGIDSIFTFVYVFTVIGGSMTLSRRGAVIAWVSFFLSFGLILVLQLDRLLAPSVEVVRAVFSFLIYSVAIALVAVLASALARKAEDAGRQLAEKQVDYEQLAELHATILRSLPGGVMTVDAVGVVRYANEAALQILRTPASEALGVPLARLAPSMAAEWPRARTQAGDERPRFEATHERSDGRQVRLGFSFAELGGAAPSALGSVVVFQDVTDRALLEEAYQRAERLASVGKVAAGFAHEVRNPLASMCASIDVLKGALDPPDPMKRLMTNVVREADRLNALITDFLAFARPREPQRRAADVSAVVAGVLDLAKNDRLFAALALELDLEPGAIAWIDPDQVRQVVWNLVRNAAEAMVERSAAKLVVRTRSEGRQARIALADTGAGIEPEQLKRVFDPFYTTKEGGSGLGLAIVHAIVSAHGGRILIESRPGRGTEVTITLPRSAEDAELARRERPGREALPPAEAPPNPGASDLELLLGAAPRDAARGA